MYISSQLQNYQELIDAILSVNCSVNTNIDSIMKRISGYPRKTTSYFTRNIYYIVEKNKKTIDPVDPSISKKLRFNSCMF